MRPDNGAAVVLAAGNSRRFGTDKRLATIDGQPMAVKALQVYLTELKSVYVVLRPSDPLRPVLPPGVQVIEALDARLGMGHSLATAAAKLTDVNWILVGLADMPWIKPDTIARIVTSICDQDDAIVKPSYRGRFGHPVGFTANFLDELKGLTGDVGAKEVIRQNRDKVIDVPVTDDAILRDVDTPQQLTNQS